MYSDVHDVTFSKENVQGQCLKFYQWELPWWYDCLLIWVSSSTSLSDVHDMTFSKENGRVSKGSDFLNFISENCLNDMTAFWFGLTLQPALTECRYLADILSCCRTRVQERELSFHTCNVCFCAVLRSQSLVTDTDIWDDAGAPRFHDCWRSFGWQDLCLQSASRSPQWFVCR